MYHNSNIIVKMSVKMLLIPKWLVLKIVILAGFLNCYYVDGHISLVFPPARKYDLDFLDNYRTPGPCGMPRGKIRTSLLAGSQFNVSWHLAYAHRGGFKLQLLDVLGRPLIDLTPVTQFSEFVEGDSTTQQYPIRLPQNFTCSNCTIRLLRKADEWGSNYRFWSCADVDILERKNYREDCSGHGKYLAGRCRCDRLYHGSRCEYKEECLDDSDCGSQGTCVDNSGTNLPTKYCYCKIGWFGPDCNKRSTIKTTEIDLSSHKMVRFSPDFVFYWRIFKDTKEFEGVMIANSTSWLGIGWKPSSLTSACQTFPTTSMPPDFWHTVSQSETHSTVHETVSQKLDEESVTLKPTTSLSSAKFVTEAISETSKSIAKRRSAKAHYIEDTPKFGTEMTVKTSVTYQVNSKQKRRKRTSEIEAVTKTESVGVTTKTVAETENVPKNDFHAMDCADMVIGMARGNVFRIGDYYSFSRSTPRLDTYWGGKDGITAALGYEDNGVTTIIFRKKMESTEFTDHDITAEQMQVLWAQGQEHGKYVHNPPVDQNIGDFYKADELKYHGHRSQRGTLELNFFDPIETNKDKDDSVSLEKTHCGREWKYPRSCSTTNFTCEYFISWNYKQKKDEIRFVVMTKNAETWTGVGFSNDEKMSQTDAILGWVDRISGRPFIMDTWISGYNQPLLDASQDIYNISGRIENGVTTLMFTRKRVTKDTKDLFFTDSECLYMMFPVRGGIFNSVNKKIRKHAKLPIISSEKICIKSCGIEEEDEESVMQVPTLQYDIDVQLVNIGNDFQVPRVETPEFEITSNRISRDFDHVFRDKIMGFFGTKLAELYKNDNNSIVAKVNVLLHYNETDESFKNVNELNAMMENVVKSALQTGKIGSLAVDPNYFVMKTPSGNSMNTENNNPNKMNNFTFGAVKFYVIYACIIVLILLALLQAACTLFKAKERPTISQKRLIGTDMWKDHGAGPKLNYGFETYEGEEKAPAPPTLNIPRSRNITDDPIYMINDPHPVTEKHQHHHHHHHQHQQQQNNHQMMSPARTTYSLPRAPGPRQLSPPPQLSYYTQDRRNNRPKSERNHSSQQPDFYFMPSQRKYSGEVVRVYVDYGNQKPK